MHVADLKKNECKPKAETEVPDFNEIGRGYPNAAIETKQQNGETFLIFREEI